MISLRTQPQPQPQNTCGGHSKAKNFEFSRLKCSRCGLILSSEDVRMVGTQRFHEHEAETKCGPVELETAASHAAFVEWLFEAARPTG